MHIMPFQKLNNVDLMCKNYILNKTLTLHQIK